MCILEKTSDKLTVISVSFPVSLESMVLEPFLFCCTESVRSAELKTSQ